MRLGPFPELYRTTQTFVIQRGDVVKRLNSDLVGWTLAPTETGAQNSRRELDAAPEDLARKNREGDS